MTRPWCGNWNSTEGLPPSVLNYPGCSSCGRTGLRVRYNGYGTCLGLPRHRVPEVKR